MAFDLQVFNKQTYAVMTETVDQDIEKFNTASNGSIVLVNKPFEGDFDIKASFKAISGLVRRRDAYGSGQLTPTRLQQILEVAVKVAAGTLPIEYEAQQYLWVKQNPELAALTIGQQLAKARMADMLNTGITGAVAAISGNADMVTDLSAKKASFRGLNRAASKMGDRSSAIRAWVMHSGTASALYDNALSNNEHLFSYDGINVMRDPFGRLFVITDSPALEKTANAYHSLGLVENGIIVNGNNDFNAELLPSVGEENIKYTYQAEWTYGVAVGGYAWDIEKGGKSPSDDKLKASVNWKQTATSGKDTAGVLVTMGDMDMAEAGGSGGIGG